MFSDAAGAAPTSSSSSGEFPDGEARPPDAAPPATCVSANAQKVQAKKPLDIIFAIDNSDSMAEEITEVENQINVNFVNIIAASNVDYRVILLSRHGTHDNLGSALQRICVRAPLSGTTCSPVPPLPANTDHFHQHDIVVDSNDAFCKILSSLNGPDLDDAGPQGWAPFLRAEAFKIFAVITDDRVNTSCNGYTFDDKFNDPISGANAAATFDSVLRAASSQFGTPLTRNYVWHSIIGLAPYDANDLSKPHPPGAPIITTTCGSTAVAPATGYQALSKLTGGLRYPTCGLDFTTVFQAMAQDAVARSVLGCEYAMPPKPENQTVDVATGALHYTSKSAQLDFDQVPSAGACGPNKFYIDGDRIKLCLDTCGLVQKDQDDPTAQLKIEFACVPHEDIPPPAK